MSFFAIVSSSAILLHMFSSLKSVYAMEQTEYLVQNAPQGKCMRRQPKELLYQFLVVLIVSTNPCSLSIFCPK